MSKCPAMPRPRTSPPPGEMRDDDVGGRGSVGARQASTRPAPSGDAVTAEGAEQGGVEHRDVVDRGVRPGFPWVARR